MLVLTRKKGERICIGEGVVITVVDIDIGRVRIGVEAPRDIPVNREEVWKAIQQQAGVRHADDQAEAG